MHTASPDGSAPHLVLNVEKLNELRRAHEIPSEVALARLLDIDAATLYRVTSGRTTPSNGFMARMKLAFPTVNLDALFHVAPAPSPSPTTEAVA